MKNKSCASVFKCVGASVLAIMIAAAAPISASAQGTIADGFFKENDETEKELTTSEIKLQSPGETKEKLKALEEFNKLLSAKKFDWSSRKNGKKYVTKSEAVKAFEGFFDNYGEYENFKKDMELFSK